MYKYRFVENRYFYLPYLFYSFMILVIGYYIYILYYILFICYFSHRFASLGSPHVRGSLQAWIPFAHPFPRDLTPFPRLSTPFPRGTSPFPRALTLLQGHQSCPFPRACAFFPRNWACEAYNFSKRDSTALGKLKNWPFFKDQLPPLLMR